MIVNDKAADSKRGKKLVQNPKTNLSNVFQN